MSDFENLPQLKKKMRVIVQSEKKIHVIDLDECDLKFEFPAIKEFMSDEESKTPIDLLHRKFKIELKGVSFE